jgi:hypothetical protein
MCWQGGFERAARGVYRHSTANPSPGLSRALLNEAFGEVSGAHALLLPSRVVMVANAENHSANHRGPEFYVEQLTAS